MEAGDLNGINKQLTIIVSNSDIEKLAYEGALMMKKAGMVKSPSQKLNLFKEGHKKLEAAIAENNDNAEWHFLRLIIQEHAPAIVNYHNHIKDDAQIVKDAFNTFSPEVQAAVSSYRKHSVALQALKF